MSPSPPPTDKPTGFCYFLKGNWTGDILSRTNMESETNANWPLYIISLLVVFPLHLLRTILTAPFYCISWILRGCGDEDTGDLEANRAVTTSKSHSQSSGFSGSTILNQPPDDWNHISKYNEKDSDHTPRNSYLSKLLATPPESPTTPVRSSSLKVNLTPPPKCILRPNVPEPLIIDISPEKSQYAVTNNISPQTADLRLNSVRSGSSKHSSKRGSEGFTRASPINLPPSRPDSQQTQLSVSTDPSHTMVLSASNSSSRSNSQNRLSTETASTFSYSQKSAINSIPGHVLGTSTHKKPKIPTFVSPDKRRPSTAPNSQSTPPRFDFRVPVPALPDDHSKTSPYTPSKTHFTENKKEVTTGVIPLILTAVTTPSSARNTNRDSSSAAVSTGLMRACTVNDADTAIGDLKILYETKNRLALENGGSSSTLGSSMVYDSADHSGNAVSLNSGAPSLLPPSAKKVRGNTPRPDTADDPYGVRRDVFGFKATITPGDEEKQD